MHKSPGVAARRISLHIFSARQKAAPLTPASLQILKDKNLVFHEGLISLVSGARAHCIMCHLVVAWLYDAAARLFGWIPLEA
mmetsp:Transcript_27067/g.81975  ORF Transcript_27067/g.81975 Transcript_27067/m.81975 type:complete len:82 (-) Transcript_27067:144-389(-)